MKTTIEPYNPIAMGSAQRCMGCVNRTEFGYCMVTACPFEKLAISNSHTETYKTDKYGNLHKIVTAEFVDNLPEELIINGVKYRKEV